MRDLILFVFTVFSLTANCQNGLKEKIVLQLINQAVDEKKLPLEVINIKDSIDYPFNVVVLQKTVENGLNPETDLKQGNVEYGIWTAEEVFTRDPYWITPSKIKIKGKKISFHFTTSHLTIDKKKCYEGVIKGKSINGLWMLGDCSWTEMQCKFDLKKLSDQSNAR